MNGAFFRRIAMSLLLVGSALTARAAAQVTITPDTLFVQVWQRLLSSRIHLDFSHIPGNTRSIKVMIPDGFVLVGMGNSRDSVRTCGTARNVKATATTEGYGEWIRPNWMVGEWRGYPECLMMLRLAETHSQTVEFPVTITTMDGSEIRWQADSAPRLTIVGHPRARWWMWVVSGALLIAVGLLLTRRSRRST
jgi:hypothetical protein